MIRISKVFLQKVNQKLYLFSVAAKSFLKFYWHQICKYKIKQNYNLDKPPLIVKIIHDVFGKEYIPESFESMSKEKITKALKEIEKKMF